MILQKICLKLYSDNILKSMKVAEPELDPVDEYQDVVLFMKNMGLIKDKSRPRQFHNNIGEIYYE